MRLLLNTWRPSTGSFFAWQVRHLVDSCVTALIFFFECATLRTHVLLHDQKDQLQQFLQFIFKSFL